MTKVTYIIAKHYIGHICYSMRIKNFAAEIFKAQVLMRYTTIPSVLLSAGVCVYCSQLAATVQAIIMQEPPLALKTLCPKK
jgi:hypothetical protein